MSSTGERQLTTTSYAILCLLTIRPGSTYELAKRMRRTLHHIWPRAESNVYAEPKRLVAAGLARSESQRIGERPRTLYTITPEGKRAVERWLAAESTPSRHESEALVKVLFGNYGTKDDLLRTLRSIAAEASATQEEWRAVASDYDRGAEWFPERVHVNALIFRWVWEQAETNARWAEWAVGQVERWPEVSEPA
ncbi:MAG: PadR family transcriptional regulator, partial [Gaiella sp.]